MSTLTTAPAAPIEPVEPTDALVERLGHAFADPALLRLALAHRSWTMENEGEQSNERLEFLGDAVLGLIVADHSYRSYDDLAQGDLTDVRKAVVNSNTLAEVAVELELGQAMLLGKGEDRAGGREKPSILADAMEAVIGAVYLDAGWEAAQAMVLRLLGSRIERAAAGPGGQDFKSRLQELTARLYALAPCYEVVDEGPDHAKRFFATVAIDGETAGRGEGRSKKQAEQEAARDAWERLVQELPEAAEGADTDA